MRLTYLSLAFLCSGLLACGSSSSQPEAGVKEIVDDGSRGAVPESRADTASRTTSTNDTQADIALEQPEKVQPEEVLPPLPRISFETTEYDFGRIAEGDVINYDFAFTNTGDAPLNIKNVTATCGCTQPSFPFLSIAPGEKGKIGVLFNSRGKVGRQKPAITVISDDPKQKHVLYLKGIVEQE